MHCKDKALADSAPTLKKPCDEEEYESMTGGKKSDEIALTNLQARAKLLKKLMGNMSAAEFTKIIRESRDSRNVMPLAGTINDDVADRLQKSAAEIRKLAWPGMRRRIRAAKQMGKHGV